MNLWKIQTWKWSSRNFRQKQSRVCGKSRRWKRDHNSNGKGIWRYRNDRPRNSSRVCLYRNQCYKTYFRKSRMILFARRSAWRSHTARSTQRNCETKMTLLRSFTFSSDETKRKNFCTREIKTIKTPRNSRDFLFNDTILTKTFISSLSPKKRWIF